MGREVTFLLYGCCRDVRGAFYVASLYPLLDCILQATAEGWPGNKRRGPERELVHYLLCLGGHEENVQVQMSLHVCCQVGVDRGWNVIRGEAS